MTRRDLIAILPTLNRVETPSDTHSVAHKGYTFILGKSRFRKLPRMTRKKLLVDAVNRQRKIEALSSKSTVLPVLPGTQIRPEDVSVFVEANLPLLNQLSRKLSKKHQYQIRVNWNKREAARHFNWESELEIDQGAARFRAFASSLLNPISSELIELPRESEMTLNVAVLVAHHVEHELDQVMQKIDSFWSEGLQIRQIGPSPAVSFASVGLKFIKASQTVAAREQLGVSRLSCAEEISAARRKALIAASPDERASILESTNIILAAKRAASDVFPMAFVWSEGRAMQPDLSKAVA